MGRVGVGVVVGVGGVVEEFVTGAAVVGRVVGATVVTGTSAAQEVTAGEDRQKGT